jgi:hypothetical protein
MQQLQLETSAPVQKTTENQNTSSRDTRLEVEWVSVNAFRGLTKIASNGDMTKSTYDNAIDLGGALYPELLGPGTSLLRRERESETTKEYRQRARWMSVQNNNSIHPLHLIEQELTHLKELLKVAEQNKEKKSSVDQLKRRVKQFEIAQAELDESRHTENQLIFRDAYGVERNPPCTASGQGFRDFEVAEGKLLRVRVLHPDKPEHITGADIIYERHELEKEAATIVAVQYKVWEERSLLLTDERMRGQIQKMNSFLCERGFCNGPTDSEFRFPHCAAFLRPTDRLQNANQKFISTGEHLPICQITNCTTYGDRGTPKLEYKGIRRTSLSSDLFEYLFNRDKIGSRLISHTELEELYKQHALLNPSESLIIYAQEF